MDPTLHDAPVVEPAFDPWHRPPQLQRADREARTAMLLLFPGLLIALVGLAAWQLAMNTASMGGDESTMVRGWDGFVRNLPSYLLLIGVAVTSFVFATRSMRHGRGTEGGPRRGPGILIASSLGLLFALSFVTRDSAEVVMTTRSATVSWMLFLVDLALVTLTVLVSSRYWRSGPGEA